MIVGIPIHNKFDVLFNALDLCDRYASEGNTVEYVIYDNGSTVPVEEALQLRYKDTLRYKVIRSEQNIGVPIACNAIMDYAKEQGERFAVFMHSDTEIYEKNWDTRLIWVFLQSEHIGVVGLFGAAGIGTPDIYQTPYRLVQMVRWGTMSGDRCRLPVKVHGQTKFTQEMVPCTVLDGFFLAVNTKLKFDEASPHHMYDNDICLEAISAGMTVWTLNMDCDHPGGKTDLGTEWNSVFEKTKQQIHSDAHVHFYHKWAPGQRNITLPCQVNYDNFFNNSD